MGNARKLKFVLAGAALCAATPALASDFSGLIYIFLGFAVVAGLFALGFVFVLRRIVRNGGVVLDLTSAALLSAALAPSGFLNEAGAPAFFWVPGWILLMLEFPLGELLPGYPISLLLIAGLVFGALHLRRSHASDGLSDTET